MKLWKVFFPIDDGDQSLNSIHDELLKVFPDKEEKDLIPVACLAGLLCRVAFSDLKIDPSEVTAMEKSISEYSDYSEDEGKKIVKIATTQIQELIDHEHHLYIRPLNDILDNDEKRNILHILFHIAASDGSVENLESEEIRKIAKGLLLSHEDFIQAKMTVRDKLKALLI